MNRASSSSPRAHMDGLTLVELMVSLVLGLLIVLVSTGLLLSVRTGFLAQDDEVQLQDGARYALETIARAVRQAAYENWDAAEAPILATAAMSPNIVGLNASRLTAKSKGLEGAISDPKEVVNGSDVLAVRFFGSGPAPQGDATMLNCAGFSVPAPASQAEADEARGWSIFYVMRVDGESSLYCKYQAKRKSATDEPNWSAQPIVRGVESFQVLYGIDNDDDGMADRYARASDPEDAAFWKNVVVVRIALLMQGSHSVRTDTPDNVIDLFGADYSDAFAAVDTGTRIRESALPVEHRGRRRAVFSTAVQVRNRVAGGA